MKKTTKQNQVIVCGHFSQKAWGGDCFVTHPNTNLVLGSYLDKNNIKKVYVT